VPTTCASYVVWTCSPCWLARDVLGLLASMDEAKPAHLYAVLGEDVPELLDLVLSVGIQYSPLVGIEFSPPIFDQEIADGRESRQGDVG